MLFLFIKHTRPVKKCMKEHLDFLKLKLVRFVVKIVFDI